MRVVTISAEYGAGGSEVGPAVAEALGLPFVDRAIPVRVAAEIGVSVADTLAHEQHAGLVSRWLAGAAQLATIGFTGPAGGAATAELVSDETFVAHTENVIRQLSTTTGGVVLGRAAAVVLADRPGVLHVRLRGPHRDRLRQAMALREVEEKTAARELLQTDRARTAYVKRFYHRDPADPLLYHVICDSTAVPLRAVVDLITAAADGLCS